ncbi:MAG TPA: tetratricopeptide repeat protein [Solirubrobacteraceae bacterium]|nr:tetratricopeptide repeat protein [Solirubrobacteraceae bacterium]
MPRPALTVPLLTFVLALGLFALLQRSDDTRAAQETVATRPLPPGASTDERVAALQAAVRDAPDGKRALAPLGLVYLQKGRETGDPAFYSRAEGILRRALRTDPRDATAVTGLGTLALARHDFRDALPLAERSRRLQPDADAAFPVLVDALVELGRYDAAARALQEFIDRKPSLPSYARVSYFRELHGDLEGAAEAMRLAVSAGGGSPENVAYVRALLGNLEFVRGHLTRARRAYEASLAVLPDHAPAEAGLARVDAAAGRFAPAISRLRTLVDRLPLPEYVVALGETELAAGRRRDARDDFDLVRVQQRLLAGRGVNTDVELALFEADHGSAERGVSLARRAWAAAPSVRSADALGWALTRAGRPAEGLRFARRALKLGWRDPLVLYHAGITARDAGRTTEARRLLRRSLARNPRFSPLYGPRAQRVLKRL